MAHIGLYVITHLGKTAFEIALEYYVRNVVINKGKILTNHVYAICNNDNPTLLDNYSTRFQGYCDMSDAINKIENANTKLAKNITQLMYSLSEEDDFVLIEHDSNNSFLLTN